MTWQRESQPAWSDKELAVVTLWRVVREELLPLQHIELEWTKEMPQLRSKEVESPSVGEPAETTEPAWTRPLNSVEGGGLAISTQHQNM